MEDDDQAWRNMLEAGWKTVGRKAKKSQAPQKAEEDKSKSSAKPAAEEIPEKASPPQVKNGLGSWSRLLSRTSVSDEVGAVQVEAPDVSMDSSTAAEVCAEEVDDEEMEVDLGTFLSSCWKKAAHPAATAASGAAAGDAEVVDAEEVPDVPDAEDAEGAVGMSAAVEYLDEVGEEEEEDLAEAREVNESDLLGDEDWAEDSAEADAPNPNGALLASFSDADLDATAEIVEEPNDPTEVVGTTAQVETIDIEDDDDDEQKDGDTKVQKLMLTKTVAKATPPSGPPPLHLQKAPAPALTAAPSPNAAAKACRNMLEAGWKSVGRKANFPKHSGTVPIRRVHSAPIPQRGIVPIKRVHSAPIPHAKANTPKPVGAIFRTNSGPQANGLVTKISGGQIIRANSGNLPSQQGSGRIPAASSSNQGSGLVTKISGGQVIRANSGSLPSQQGSGRIPAASSSSQVAGNLKRNNSWQLGNQQAQPVGNLNRNPSWQQQSNLAKRPRTDTGVIAAKDTEGRPYNLQSVVVNFANVGASYAKKVLKRSEGAPGALFDWNGVRLCVTYLTKNLGLKVTGVIYENFWGTDNNSKDKKEIPGDIRSTCESIEETPRIIGTNHRSADDEMTIKCAYYRNCRFMDNDNYRDWKQQLRDERCRAWLDKCQDLLHMRYYFDSSMGFFETLDGNVPPGLLAPDGNKIPAAVTKKALWSLPNR